MIGNDISRIPAVILCGGQGTRIRGVADGVPKPLIDVGGRPIVWHIMKTYSFYGVRRFILCLGYKGDAIIDYFRNYKTRNHSFTMRPHGREDLMFHAGDGPDHDVDEWEITFALTGEHTMTGGRLKRVAEHVGGGPFFATYGDGLSDVDLRALLEFHRSHGRMATLTGVHLPTTFGIVESESDGRITSFREKPVLPGRINGGFFVFENGIFEHIDGDATVLEDMPFRRLVRSDGIRMYPWDGFWHCMDTFKDHQELNHMWSQAKAPWKLWA